MAHDEHIRHHEDMKGSHLKNAVKHAEHHQEPGHHMVEQHKVIAGNTVPMGTKHLPDHVPPTPSTNRGPAPRNKVPADSTGN